MDTQSLWVIVGVGVAFGVLWWFKRADIPGKRARELVAAGARLVDVRSSGEFAAAHIEGARNIPVGEISRRSNELGGREQPVIVYCASGTRSAMAKRTLKSAGFSHVYNLGAMSNW
jgi:rhodanese-related sulfurtransferase